MERLALRRPRSRRAMRAYLSDMAVNTAPAAPAPPPDPSDAPTADNVTFTADSTLLTADMEPA